MKKDAITAKEIVDHIYAYSKTESERKKKLRTLQDSIECHKEARRLEIRARKLIGELVDFAEGKKNDG